MSLMPLNYLYLPAHHNYLTLYNNIVLAIN